MTEQTTRSPPPPPHLQSSSPAPSSPPTSQSPNPHDMMEPSLSPAPTLNQREQVRLEFYRTYDVMTGVRIAATLGGFFGMMVLLVVYKSRCRYGKSAISDVQLAAAAAAVEEEEQQEAVAAALYMQSIASARCPRRSLGNMSAPLPLAAGPLQPSSLSILGQGGTSAAAAAASCNPSTVRMSLRFSSVGGHSLLNPPTAVTAGKRPSRRASCAVTRHVDLTGSGRSRYPAPQRAHSADSEVPAVISTLGVIESSPDQPSSSDSPPASASISVSISGPGVRPHDAMNTGVSSPVDPADYPGFPGDFSERPPRRAPLARISTCGGSRDTGDDKSHSVGSDSVFMAGGDDLDTEDEVDEFSTDSETFKPPAERGGTARLRHFPRRPLAQLSPAVVDAPLGGAIQSSHLGSPSEVPERHLSAPAPTEPPTPTNATTPLAQDAAISNSQSCRTLKATSPTPGSTSVLYPSGDPTLPPSDTSSSESLLIDPDGIKPGAVLKISIHEPVTVKSRELLQARPSKVFASLDSAASDERSLTPDQAPTVLSKHPASDEELASESTSGRRFSEHLSLKVVRKPRKLSCDESRCPQKGSGRFVTSTSCDVLNKHLVVTLEPEQLASQSTWSEETLF